MSEKRGTSRNAQWVELDEFLCRMQDSIPIGEDFMMSTNRADIDLRIHDMGRGLQVIFKHDGTWSILDDPDFKSAKGDGGSNG